MTTPTMHLKAIAGYFGGKRTMADIINNEFYGGPVKVSSFFDVCCGSIAVLLGNDNPPSQETVNDLHTDMINMARVLQSSKLAPTLYNNLQRTLCSIDLFKASRAVIESDVDFILSKETNARSVERAYHFFLLSWMGRNGVTGLDRIKYQMAVRYTPGGGGSGTRFVNAVESIPAWHERLRKVTILKMDMFDLLPKIDDQEDVAVYIDPTYLAHTTGSNSKYRHQMSDNSGDSSINLFTGERSDNDDHDRLAKEATRFKHARVVISYYASKRLSELYPGWTVVDCKRQKNLHVQNKRGAGASEAPEILIINGPSYLAA